MKKIIAFIVLTLTFSSPYALAHKVIVFAWVEQGRIHVEGSFGSDRPAKNCVIKVTGLNGALVHQGITDDKGMHSFVLPETPDSDLVIEMNAGPGHLGHWTIPRDDLGGDPTPESIEKKMAEKNLLEQSPSLARIAAGIALIFGVAFVAAWIKRKKERGRMLENTLADGNSPIHSLDPKIRILSACFLSIAAALCDNLIIALGYLAIALGVTGLARLPIKTLIKRLSTLFWFLLMIWIFLPLTFGGNIVFEYGWLRVSSQGILLSAKITLKSVAILLMFSSLVATMPMAALGSGLHHLKVPDKLVFLLLMTYRYIAVIQGEYLRLLRAAKFRGFKPGTNLHSYKTYAFLAGMLFVRASFRAKRVYQAMRCRGFQEKFHTLDFYPANGLNYPFLWTMLLLAAGLVLMELTWI